MNLEEIWAKKIGTEIVNELGEGGFGKAFETEDGRVIKLTSSIQEACCAALIIGEQSRTMVGVHDVKIFPNECYGILMDLVEQETYLDWAFEELDQIKKVTGVAYHEITEDLISDHSELEGIDLLDQTVDLIDAIAIHMREAEQIGFTPEDIKTHNTGTDSKGDIRFFDHFERNSHFTKKFLMETLSRLPSHDVEVNSLSVK